MNKVQIRYKQLLTQKQIVRLLKLGCYRVEEDGTVTGPRGVVTPFEGNERCDLFVRLYNNGRRKTIAVVRLIWLANTLTPIPPHFEVHHLNLDRADNRWDNLVLLHEKDHRKIHKYRMVEVDTAEEVLF